MTEDRAERFTWRLEDLEFGPSPTWDLTYQDGRSSVLVQNLDDLVRYLIEQPGFDGDLAGALDAFCASEAFRFAPTTLVGDIVASTGAVGIPPLPRQREGRPRQADGTARHGYGLEVFERDRYRCRYCGLDMRSTYQAWLQLSVDHVVPAQMARRGYPKDLIEDKANLVTCCRTCNDFGNRFVVTDPAPTSDDAFFDLRDRVFVQRRARISLAHGRERAYYAALPRPDGASQTGEQG